MLTTCFQRDSAKDQAVVFIFIGATVGLLGWAGLRPWIEGWREACIYLITSVDLGLTKHSATDNGGVIYPWQDKAISKCSKTYIQISYAGQAKQDTQANQRIF